MKKNRSSELSSSPQRRSPSRRSPSRRSPQRRRSNNLNTKCKLPLEIADALNVKNKDRMVSYIEIPGLLQSQIIREKRIQGDRNIPLDAITDKLKQVLGISAPLSDMELTAKLWSKIRT